MQSNNKSVQHYTYKDMAKHLLSLNVFPHLFIYCFGMGIISQNYLNHYSEQVIRLNILCHHYLRPSRYLILATYLLTK